MHYRNIITMLFLIVVNLLAGEKNMEKKIVVFGSSVASGWVSSRDKQYDMQNGWAFRLERLLKPQGWQVINSGVPGDNSEAALKRIDKDLLDHKPGIAIISLSLGNEGIGKTNPDLLISGFISNLKIMIDKCKDAGIQPVLGNCYGSNSYSADDLAVIKKANSEINKLKLPVINLLGSFSDENGHFPNGHNFDDGHPDNFGHEELFLGIVPDLFEQLLNGKTQVADYSAADYLKIGNSAKIKELCYVPTELCHSFSLAVEISDCQDFQLKIAGTNGLNLLTIQNGVIEYLQNGVKTGSCKVASKVTKLIITHAFAAEKTEIYSNGKKMISATEKIEPLNFTLSSGSGVEAKNLLIYRGALSPEEVSAIQDNQFITAGLELYSPLSNDYKNLALSGNSLLQNSKDQDLKVNQLKEKVTIATAERASTPIFKDKEAIELLQTDLKQFAGTFFGEQCGDLIIELNDGKLLLSAFGTQAPMLPESKTKIFLRHPAEVTVSYDAEYNSIELNAMGQKFSAKRK